MIYTDLDKWFDYKTDYNRFSKFKKSIIIVTVEKNIIPCLQSFLHL